MDCKQVHQQESHDRSFYCRSKPSLRRSLPSLAFASLHSNSLSFSLSILFAWNSSFRLLSFSNSFALCSGFGSHLLFSIRLTASGLIRNFSARAGVLNVSGSCACSARRPSIASRESLRGGFQPSGKRSFITFRCFRNSSGTGSARALPFRSEDSTSAEALLFNDARMSSSVLGRDTPHLLPTKASVEMHLLHGVSKDLRNRESMVKDNESSGGMK